MTAEVTNTGNGESKTAFKLSDFEAAEPETVEVEGEEAEKEEVETDGETGENGTGEPEGEELEDETEEAPAKSKGKPIQERFNEVTAKRKEAERVAQEASRAAEYWRGVAEGRIKPQAEAEPQVETKLERPNPEAFEFGDADPAYLEALTDWKVETRLAKAEQGFQERQREAEVRTAIDTMEAQYSQRLESVKEELPDYDDKVTASAANGEWPCPPLVAIAIKASEVGPKIAYHLATNLDEAVAIANMAPIEQAVAFGRLEGRFQNTQPKPVKVTSAPPPPQNRTRGSGGKFEPGDRALYRKMLSEFR